MATGAAPAPIPETKVEAQASTETSTAPLTFAQRIQRLFREVFEGREDHLGWHQ